MPRLVLALVLGVAALALAAPAEARTVLVLEGGQAEPQPWQGWVDRATVPTPDVRVTLRRGDCDGTSYVEYDHASGPLICLSPSGERNRRTLLHEVGHLFDRYALDDHERGAFARLLRESRDWRAGAPNSPHEKFAEAYSACATLAWTERAKWRSRWWRVRHRVGGGYAYMPTFFEHRKVCARVRARGG